MSNVINGKVPDTGLLHGVDAPLEFDKLPPAQRESLRGEKGVPGVYIGSGNMPDGYSVQIDPNGDSFSADDIYHTGNKPTAADIGALSSNGDTMKGELRISYGTFPRVAIVAGNCLTSVEGAYNKSSIQNYNAQDDSSNRRIINLYNSSGQADIAKALELVEYKNNATAYYNILHTGNKPSGSYTGNGSAEYRTIETGGIGNCCVVYGGTNHAAYLTPIGAFFHSGGTMAFTSDVSFANGVIRLGNAYIINTASTTYNYQVL